MPTITHQIAGIVFRSELDTPISCFNSRRFENFLIEHKPPDVVQRYRGVRLDRSLPPFADEELSQRLAPCIPSASWNTHTPFLNSPAVRALLQSRLEHPESVTIEMKPSGVSIFDFEKREMDFFYASGEQEDFLAECLVTPIVFANFLTLFSAVMIHSSSAVVGGRAAIFLAPDEGGKTTIVKSATDGTVLCDDQVVLRKQGDAFMAHGSPWGLITNSTRSSKLGGFFLAEKAERFEILPIKPAAVFEYLWNEHESYRYFLPKNLRLQAFNLLYEACHQALCYKMFFPKDGLDWAMIDKAMK